MKSKIVDLLSWTVTSWQMNGQAGWKLQPVILVEGQVPFFADHPDAYIVKLLELHDDHTLARGQFFTFIGQFQDALEQFWNKESPHENSVNRNGHRQGRKLH